MTKDNGRKGQMEQYFIIKRSTQLPPKVNIIFSIMERVIEIPEGWKSVSSNTKQHNKPFLQAFSKLAIDEQSHFMNQLIKYVVKLLNKKQDQTVQSLSEIQHIQTSVQVYSTYLKIPLWLQYNFRLDKLKKIIYLNSKKKNEIIDLHNYLIRKSKKFKDCIVLQGVSSQANKNEIKKYILSFHNDLGKQMYQQLFMIVIQIQRQQFQKIIKGGQNTIMKTKSYSGENSNMVFLSSKNINEFLNFKDTISKYMLSNKVDFKNVTVGEKQYRIQQASKMEKIFRLEACLPVQSRFAKENFLKNLKNKKGSILISSQILESFSGRYFALYDKYLISNKIQELITIREQSLADNDDLIFVKGIDNMMVKNFLEFLSVKISQEGGQSKLTIVCSVFLNEYITLDVIKYYLKTLYENALSDKTKIMKSKSLQVHPERVEKQKDEQFDVEQFRTVFGNAFNEEYVQFVQGDEQIETEIKNTLNISQKIQESNQRIELKYLMHRYQLGYIEGYDPKKHLMKQHYLWKDWTRRKQGGVICTNDEIVNAQKKLFKDTITALGHKILKGGTNVLNLSLPVTIFKQESHLYSIARDFTYAPLLFQKCPKDPLERVKYCTLLIFSIGFLGISMDKPFNPLLGETLQTWIGGCPMYLQQIIHHPPVGSYYFIGNGYKIFGQIEPKISFGINNVKGYSERPNRIIFDDGTQIDLLYGKMTIYGLMFGQREFNFEDKVFAYNKTDHIFSEIFYGPRKKGVFSKSSQPWDFCYGKIYKLKEQFRQKFDSTYPRIFPTKQYIVKELSTFEGVWNEVIQFDKVKYIDFRTEFPCEMTEQQFPLPSNSHYRKDLQLLLEGNIPESQKYKQIMQEIQRRDKKLRQKYKSDQKLELNEENKKDGHNKKLVSK